MIVLDAITEALKEIGALAIGEVPTADEAQDALTVLNLMLDMWRTESLMIYNIIPNVFPLVAGKGMYTLGTGGDFNIPRPDTIVDAYVRDANNNDFKVGITTDSQEYSDIISKYVQSSIPTLLYDNGDYPLKQLQYWPVPSDGSYRAVLWTWGIISEFGTINDTINLPSGYKGAIVTNLALNLCDRYGKAPTATLTAKATATKGQIKRFNTDVPDMGFPDGITGKGKIFNYYTGQPK